MKLLCPKLTLLPVFTGALLALQAIPALASNFDDINLGTLTITEGFRMDGTGGNNQFGNSVRRAGDINDDGINDFIVGAPFRNPGLKTLAGSSYVIYGKIGGYPSGIDLAAFTAAMGFRVDGAADEEYSGFSVSAAGDVNDDDIDDILIGAYNASPKSRNRAGTTYVIYGKQGGYVSPIDLLNLNSTIGFRIDGAEINHNCGYWVDTAGDINDDGIDDIIMGISQRSGYVIYGKQGGYPSGIDLAAFTAAMGFRMDGPDESYFGYRPAVSSVGDVNDDGIDDVIIVTPNFTSSSCYVVYGKEGGYTAPINLSSLTNPIGFRINYCGNWVGAAGDVNNDGIDDIIIGDSAYEFKGKEWAGATFVVYGKQGGYAAPFNLITINSTIGFRIDGAMEDDYFGTSVSSAGDVNGDGINDVIVGANGADPGNRTDAGSSYVIYGKQGGYAVPIDLSSLNKTIGFRIDGAAAGDKSGWSVSAAGDVNNDGISDLILGANTADPNNILNAGASYVIYGKNEPPVLRANALSIHGTQAITLSSLNLNATDIDNDNNGLIFKIHNLQEGLFLNALNQSLTQFTQQEVTSGRVQFLSASCSQAPSYEVSISDVVHTTVPAVAQVSFTSCTSGDNEPPVLEANALSIHGTQAITLSSLNLNATDIDNDNNGLIFKIHNLQEGLFLNALNQSLTQFTQQEVTLGRVQFLSASCSQAPSYEVSVSDVIHTTVPAAAQVSFTSCASGNGTNGGGDNTLSAASSLQPSWYNPAKWFSALVSYWQTPKPMIATPEAEALVKLQAKCESLIEEADGKTADRWYRNLLEDVCEEMNEALDKPSLIRASTVKRFKNYLKDLDRAYLKHPLLEKPSYFASSNLMSVSLKPSCNGIELLSAAMPMIGGSYMPAALGN